MKLITLILALFFWGCSSRHSLRAGSEETARPSYTNDQSLPDTAETDTTLSDTSLSKILQDTSLSKIDSSVDFADIVKEIEEEPYRVRIALSQKKKDITLFAYGRLTVEAPQKRIRIRQGVVRFSVEGEMVRVSAHGKSTLINTPCDLSIPDGRKLFSYGNNDYRGDMQIITPVEGELTLINALPVETYLRGVVPLEIGRKGNKDFAAVQAQAIAARTYSFKRMEERKNWNYDLLPTVADQVYGGASAEHILADRAIQATDGLIMTYKKDMVDALYHSTCGGRTASKQEVWGGSPFPYLKGRSDLMENGAPYCGISPLYRWKENWSVTEFSRLVNKYSRQTPKQELFSGKVNSVKLLTKTVSGRVSACRISGNSGNAHFGGDKIRFVFRRPVAGNGILRSSAFTLKKQGDRIIAEGRGYGHGIGMCQMGAIARARRGQNYSDILNAYYTDVSIEDVDDYFRRQEQLRKR